MKAKATASLLRHGTRRRHLTRRKGMIDRIWNLEREVTEEWGVNSQQVQAEAEEALNVMRRAMLHRTGQERSNPITRSSIWRRLFS